MRGAMSSLIRACALSFALAASFVANAPGAMAQTAKAQTYPDRPVRILVPYAPGGITDIAARVLGARLGEVWGHQVVVENRSDRKSTRLNSSHVLRSRMPSSA